MKIADLKIRICFRELEKHIEERIDTNLCFLTEIELKEYKESQALLSTIKEREEVRRAEKIKEGAQNTTPVVKLPIKACKLFKDTGLCKSLGEAKRFIPK